MHSLRIKLNIMGGCCSCYMACDVMCSCSIVETWSCRGKTVYICSSTETRLITPCTWPTKLFVPLQSCGPVVMGSGQLCYLVSMSKPILACSMLCISGH